MKDKCECLICDWFAIQDKYGNLEQVKCNKCGKDLLFSYHSHLLQELKEKVQAISPLELTFDAKIADAEGEAFNDAKNQVLQIISD